jgi:hypothetical protein
MLCSAWIAVLTASTASPFDISLKEGATKYYAHGNLDRGISIGADFLGRYLPVPGMTIYSDEYIFVEVALFGPAGARAELKNSEFTLRINGTTLTPQSPGLVTLQNNFPEMQARPQVIAGAEAGSGQIEIGGRDRKPRFPGDDSAHTPGTIPQAPTDPAGGNVPQKPRDPEELVRASELPMGSHALPEAGYLFFYFEGKLKKIKHSDLEYKGALGSVTLTLR